MNENVIFTFEQRSNARYITVCRTLSGFVTAISILLLPVSAHALSCETELSKFDFMETSAGTSVLGTRKQVTEAYDALQEILRPLASYNKTTVFYMRDFSGIVDYECPKIKCSPIDIYMGLVKCAHSMGDLEVLCRPLAAVYNDKLYCLLFPGLKPGEPYRQYIPFESEEQADGE